MMFCPTCNTECKNIEIITKEEVYPVRGDKIPVSAKVALCALCKTEVFDEELDEENLLTAYDEYRRRKGIVTIEDIVTLRARYGLSQRALSRLLGWSEATIYRYETGALPSEAHNYILKRLADPVEAKRLLEKARGRLTLREVKNLEQRISFMTREELPQQLTQILKESVDRSSLGIERGFCEFDPEKLIEMMIFFAEKLNGVFKTKLMKLLWYADFFCFKTSARSISGACYINLPFGPVPDNWQLLLGLGETAGAIVMQPVAGSDWEGEEIAASRLFRRELFTLPELEAMEKVAAYFKNWSAKQISELSHREEGYQKTGRGDIISYEYGLSFSLA